MEEISGWSNLFRHKFTELLECLLQEVGILAACMAGQ